jgi:hypothetical protein
MTTKGSAENVRTKAQTLTVAKIMKPCFTRVSRLLPHRKVGSDDP